ncbi:putative sulfate exporter family transporter [Tianweitania sp. BSSL-BM11]|uniref:Sulfate exporter family transporter n=1 Tax=Tianweitania aestuarii TaxID=2814886 RepID=A0ABS5S2R4_9HYPH|nr:putative sulfate exporter family transporter [Tianweitania aestuarii]MBS9722217.1 putative sulfate exporter family transporter [Tianweitania aestuarii]
MSQGKASVLPGVVLCVGVAAIGFALEQVEHVLFGKAWLEALVLAILVGAMIRTFWVPPALWRDGISFSAKYLLEIAVVLLGASVSASAIFAAGFGLFFAIAGIVLVAILLSYCVGRLLGLSNRIALLVACGNSICGNSAIVAVAPVIGADSKDVATSIAFTAVLGVVVVLGLPLVGYAISMDDLAYGAFAGLTVYAVPQVLAAASPFGAAAVQMATLVKLMRVLMLGPVCSLLAILVRTRSAGPSPQGVGTQASSRMTLTRFVPWFILGFLGMIVIRSLGFIPDPAVAVIGHVATLLTVISMAALGLGVDVRTIMKAGSRVVTTVVLSLILLGAISLVVIEMLGL